MGDADRANALDAGGIGRAGAELDWTGDAERANALDAGGVGRAGAELLPAWDPASNVDAGEAGTELVFCGGATHWVQMVLVLVIKTVDMLVVISIEVVLPNVLVFVTGQLVIVVYTISLVTWATRDSSGEGELVTPDRVDVNGAEGATEVPSRSGVVVFFGWTTVKDPEGMGKGGVTDLLVALVGRFNWDVGLDSGVLDALDGTGLGED